ncbi:ATP-dependent endonuclease [Streptosporangium algeriense]|uniref:ATP-dependent endonuclease n=1 Tax=Streptosporangium algeriense TaxID=1682748 RepID=A0ABW3DH22_9ACTN
MYLNSFSVSGFRSLMDVRDIPVSAPTILAGHNDGGKTAVLSAVSFLIGDYELVEDDRTYLSVEDGRAVSRALSRRELTEVEGVFALDEWEQETFGLPAELRVRRCAGEDLISRLECWLPIPHDERLRDLSGYRLPELKELAKEFGLSPASQRKADVQDVLQKYGAENAGPAGWVGLPPALGSRMPRVLAFGGQASSIDESIKSVLMDRFQAHMADEKLQGQLQTLETSVKDQLRIDAKSLCDHIQSRCPDLTDVFVEPDVSFTRGFRGARLRIARTSGEHVGLERSGQGSARRISLAIWEWTSELLVSENSVAPELSQDESAPLEPAPLQTIIVYDEPDTHLDYGHQRKIMQLIREQSAVPHVRVIVATHSMNLIDGVDISDVVNLKLQNGRTVMERLGANDHDAIDQHLRQLAAALGLRNSVLLHERCFLAVEGSTEQRAIPLLFRLSEGMSLQSAGIALWACFNNEGALHLARYLVEHGRSVVLAVDADSRNVSKSIFKPERLRQTFGENVGHIVKMIGEPDGFNEFEELFDDDLWSLVANKVWPRENPWMAEDFGALRGQGKFSTAVQRMLQEQSESGPGGKPEMMYQLALTLTDPSDVPAQLRKIFQELRQLAV